MQMFFTGKFQSIRQNTIQFKATADWPRNLLEQIATKLLIRFLNGTRISEASPPSLFRFLLCHKQAGRSEKFCGVEAAFSVSRLDSTFQQSLICSMPREPRLKYPLSEQRFHFQVVGFIIGTDFRPNVTSYIKLVHAFHILIRELLRLQLFLWNQ